MNVVLPILTAWQSTVLQSMRFRWASGRVSFCLRIFVGIGLGCLLGWANAEGLAPLGPDVPAGNPLKLISAPKQDRNPEDGIGKSVGNSGEATPPPLFEQGVAAYRAGKFSLAQRYFVALHEKTPENTSITYYLALSEAQLGRFQQAKKRYEEVLLLEPHGELARLAQLGLSYLPADAAVDLPPRFQWPDGEADPNRGNPSNAVKAPQSMGTSSPSAQDLMMWQLMMGQMGGNPSGMGAAMPGMMMPNGATSGANSVDPSVMSNFLMNQMMQNFSLGGEKDENR